MPASPLSFFGPSTWLDDDEIDRAIHASRLAALEYDTHGLAELIGKNASYVRTAEQRGWIPPHHRQEQCEGGVRNLWTADQVAGVLIERGVSV